MLNKLVDCFLESKHVEYVLYCVSLHTQIQRAIKSIKLLYSELIQYNIWYNEDSDDSTQKNIEFTFNN